MSGGALNYLNDKVNDAVFDADTPERVAFAKHLDKVVKALHDIELVDSGDYGPGDEKAAIFDCIGPMAILEAHLDMLNADIQALQKLTEEVK
jgi:hypothetical protein